VADEPMQAVCYRCYSMELAMSHDAKRHNGIYHRARAQIAHMAFDAAATTLQLCAGLVMPTERCTAMLHVIVWAGGTRASLHTTEASDTASHANI